MDLQEGNINSSSNLFQKKLARFFTLIASIIDFLGRTAWPVIDLLFRIWLGKQLLIGGILQLTNWDVSLWLATSEYPIPWLDPQWEAVLGIGAQLIGGTALLLGFFTRIGALAVLLLALLTQIYYIKLDVNLFWITLMAAYVLRGPGPFSLDHLFHQGLSDSPFPFAMNIATFLRKTKKVFSNLFLFALRIWLMITLLIAGGHLLTMTPTKIQSFSTWLPLYSAQLLFGYASIFLAFLFGFGFATRLSSLIGLIIICYTQTMAGKFGHPIYWMMVMAILFVSGPGMLSLDQLLLNILKRRYPQLSGKPAFTLDNLPHIVIIGAGFGGIACAKALRHVPVKVTLIDRNNYHLFQPLLYQIATGNLSSGDIAVSIRSIFLNQFNAEVLLGEVTAIDKENKVVITNENQIPYDYLVIATGATHSYFGKDIWAPYAPGLKSIEDAIAVRSRIIETFERAELATTDDERQRLLNFVIVGGGPTGVELAGAIVELARFGMEKDFRHFDPGTAKIILVQSAPRLLPAFSEKISAIAQQSLERMGVTVLTNSKVEQIDAEGVMVQGQRIYSKSVLWAAGVTASPAAKWLQVEADPAGRVKVANDFSVPNYAAIFVIGDTAAANVWKGKPMPGLAPAAKQSGKFVAKKISALVYKQPAPNVFSYTHLGSLATIGRKAAVAEFNHVKLSGSPAWWFWGLVHVSFLVGARNRFSVISNWMWSYFTFRANNLLITSVKIQNTKKESD
jgi:NADH:ubiquinone reductase (H+-translocating)